MRITRILANMNVTGFRRYALELVKFLEREIYGKYGYENFLNDKTQMNKKISLI